MGTVRGHVATAWLILSSQLGGCFGTPQVRKAWRSRTARICALSSRSRRAKDFIQAEDAFKHLTLPPQGRTMKPRDILDQALVSSVKNCGSSSVGKGSHAADKNQSYCF